MLHWLLSTHARKDLATFSLSGATGYGLMSGERIGHITVVSRLLLLGPDIAQSVKTYNQSILSGFDVPLGLFALDTDLPATFSFHGLCLILGQARKEMVCWRFVNGSNQISREVMEKINDS